MAVFIARLMAGDDSNVPASGTANSQSFSCTVGGNSLFTDVPPESGYCKYIHYIYSHNITSGCGGGQFCPSGVTTRAQMAVFIARAMVSTTVGGVAVPSSYTDPVTLRSYDCGNAQANFFTDVDDNHFACSHIYYIWAKGITSGIGGGLYGPSSQTTRGQMAAFLSKGFTLKLYKP
jgi:hypothetical protein